MKKFLSTLVLAALFLMPQMLQAQSTASITFAVNNATMGTTNPAPGTYNYSIGSTFTLTAIPNTGYVLSDWVVTMNFGGQMVDIPTGNNDLTISDVVSSEYDNVVITAVFVPTGSTPDPDTVDVTIGLNGSLMGTTSPAPGHYRYAESDGFSVTAIPNSGCQLTNWMVAFTAFGQFQYYPLGIHNLTITHQDYADVLMFTDSIEIIPVFDSIHQTDSLPLTIIVDNTYSFGHTSPAAGTYYYPEGGNYDFDFIPDSGYYCKGYLRTTIRNGVEYSNVTWYHPFPPYYDREYHYGNVIYYPTTIRVYFGSARNPLPLVCVNAYAYYDGSVVVYDFDGGTVSGTGVYNIGDSVTLVATPQPGYHFVGWLDGNSYNGVSWDTVSHDMTYSFVANNVTDGATYYLSNFEYYAIFEEDGNIEYEDLVIGVNNSTLGTTNPAPGTYQMPYGSSVSITAIPNEGNSFVRWTDEDGMTIGYSNPLEYGIWTTGGTQTVIANFVEGEYIPDSVTITVAVNNSAWGTTTPAPGTYTFAETEQVQFLATPNNGYFVMGWAVSVTMNGMTIRDTMFRENEFFTDFFDLVGYQNIVLTALFTDDSMYAPDRAYITITTNSPTMGTTNPAPGTYTFYDGDEVTITAIPNEGYRLVDWTLTVTMYGQTYTEPLGEPLTTLTYPVFVDEEFNSFTITAIFGPDNISADSLTVAVGVDYPHRGTVTPAAGTYNYAEGDVVTVTATANQGYFHKGWHVTLSHPLYGVIEDEIINDPIPVVSFEVERDMLGYFYTIVALFDASEGIENVSVSNINAYSKEGHICLTGAEGREVYVFDINGRMLHHGKAVSAIETYSVPTSGIYLIRVCSSSPQGTPIGVETKRVVVIR